MLNGDETTKKQIRDALIKRLKKGNRVDFDDISPLLMDDSSEAYYNALLTMGDFEDILPEIARIKGVKELPHIFKVYKNVMNNTMNPRYVINYMGYVLKRLEQFHHIDKTTEKLVVDLTKKSNTVGFYLYEFKDKPNKIKSDTAYINTILKKAQDYDLIPKKIPQRLKYVVQRAYCNDHYYFYKDKLMEMLKVQFAYNANPYAGSSHFTDKSTGYATIMEQFMEAAQLDLPKYYQDTYLRYDSNMNPHFALFLGSENTGYVLELDGNKLIDENHLAIVSLFNTTLKQEQSEKQFTVKADTTTYKNDIKIARYEKENAINGFLKSF